MGSPDDRSPASEAQRLIAETLRVPLDSTVRDAFTPRQKALLAELEQMEAEGRAAKGGEAGPAAGD
jgi:hypothetical protein